MMVKRDETRRERSKRERGRNLTGSTSRVLTKKEICFKASGELRREQSSVWV